MKLNIKKKIYAVYLCWSVNIAAFLSSKGNVPSVVRNMQIFGCTNFKSKNAGIMQCTVCEDIVG